MLPQKLVGQREFMSENIFIYPVNKCETMQSLLFQAEVTAS